MFLLDAGGCHNIFSLLVGVAYRIDSCELKMRGIDPIFQEVVLILPLCYPAIVSFYLDYISSHRTECIVYQKISVSGVYVFMVK